LTVTVIELVFPFAVETVIVAVPEDFAVTSPCALTVTILLLLESHVIVVNCAFDGCIEYES
jgi:hypothetical protein